MPDWPRSFPIGLIAFPAGNGKQMTDGGKTNNTLIGKRARRKGSGFGSRKYRPGEPQRRTSPVNYPENRSRRVEGRRVEIQGAEMIELNPRYRALRNRARFFEEALAF